MRAANNARQMVVQRLADTAKLEPVAGNAPTPKVQRRVDESPRFKDGWSGGGVDHPARHGDGHASLHGAGAVAG